MPKKILVLLALALTSVGTPALFGAPGSQETKNEPSKEQQAAKGVLQTSDKKNEAFYRLDYTVYELEHGKRTNTRNYMLKAGEGSRSSFHVGNRVPIPSTIGGAYSYNDVGVQIDSWVKRSDAGVSLETRMSITSLADSESTGSAHGLPPVLRNFNLEDASLVDLGKPALIGGIDDAGSDRRYEIEVTVTKVK